MRSSPLSRRPIKSLGCTSGNPEDIRGGDSASSSGVSSVSSRRFYMRLARMRAAPNILAVALRSRRDGVS